MTTMLIFAAKKVGLSCLSFLFEAGEKIELVIISNEQEIELIEFCSSNKINYLIFSDDSLNKIIANKRKYGWILNLWSPHKLPIELLSMAGCRVNLHPSLVPHCRGNDCAAWAIRSGAPIGVSILEMNSLIDDAGIYIQKELKLNYILKGRELHELLQNALIDLFLENWNAIKLGALQPYAQSVGGSYFTRHQTEMDRFKNCSEVLRLDDTIRWIRSHDFFPGTTAEVEIDGIIYSLQLELKEIRKINII
ncbi:MAG: hypothetical protein WCO61_03015 [Alphaproteobacteria bacterium]